MVAEGARLVGELRASAITPVEVFVTAAFAAGDEAPGLVDGFAGETVVVEVTDEVMREMSDTVTPQGILAVLPLPDLAVGGGPQYALIPDQVRDPGNLGTMLRTAWAADVTQVLLPPGTADPTNPKVVRAAMGAHFRLPIRSAGWDEIWDRVGDARVLVAEARRGESYDEADWCGDVALVIGGEAAGAGREARAGASYVHIPMARGAESLNAAIAAGILLFEGARQRRGCGLSPLAAAPPR